MSPHSNFVAGLVALFASLYVFNLGYLEGASCTLEFVFAGPACRCKVRDDSSSAAAQCSVGHPLVLHQWPQDAGAWVILSQEHFNCCTNLSKNGIIIFLFCLIFQGLRRNQPSPRLENLS